MECVRVWGKASRRGEEERNIVRSSSRKLASGHWGFVVRTSTRKRSGPVGYSREDQLPSQEPSQEPGLKVLVETYLAFLRRG